MRLAISFRSFSTKLKSNPFGVRWELPELVEADKCLAENRVEAAWEAAGRAEEIVRSIFPADKILLEIPLYLQTKFLFSEAGLRSGRFQAVRQLLQPMCSGLVDLSSSSAQHRMMLDAYFVALERLSDFKGISDGCEFVLKKYSSWYATWLRAHAISSLHGVDNARASDLTQSKDHGEYHFNFFFN